MKYILILIIAIGLNSCCEAPKKPPTILYTYNVVYTDGSSEEVEVYNKFKHGEGDCLITCKCNGHKRVKLCGVRKFELLSEKVVKDKEKKVKSKKTRPPKYKPHNE